MSEALKRAAQDREKEQAEAAKWPATYQRFNETTGWRGEVFEFRRGSMIAHAFEDGYALAGTHAIEFTMADGAKKIVRPAEAQDVAA